jgi:hypothetical protein
MAEQGTQMMLIFHDSISAAHQYPSYKLFADAHTRKCNALHCIAKTCGAQTDINE